MKAFRAGVIALAFVSAACSARAETVVVRVNGAPITDVQVDQWMQRMAAQPDPDGAGDAAKPTRDDAVQLLVSMELLTQQAKAEKIEAAPEEIDKQIAEIKAQFPSAEAYTQALAANHSTDAEVRRETARSLVMQKVLDRHVSVKLAPDAAEGFYKENQEQFQQPAQVRASHILLRAATEGADASAPKKRAEEALARLHKGEDFATLAKELSEDPGSAANGGDLGFFARERMVPAFSEAAFGLKPGQLSGVVETPFGFHLIKVTDKHAAGLAPFADVKEQVEGFLEEQEHDKQERAYVEQLKAKAKIEIVEPKSAKPKK